MNSRAGLGLSNIAASEFRSSPLERVGKIAIFLVALVLLAGFFAYLTGRVQLGAAQATDPDASWKSESQ